MSVCGSFLSQDVGFRFGIATFDRPATRDGLMERLSADFVKTRVLLTALDVRNGEGSLLRRVQDHLAVAPTPDGWQRAVAVVNLEDRLTYSDVPIKGGFSGARDLAFLEDANLHRDAFPAACPCPLLFWLTAPAETALAKHAPDLWHWRSARFDFEREGAFLDDFRNHPAERRAWFEKIAAASHRLGDQRGELGDLINLGNAKSETGDVYDAIQDYTTALVLARQMNDQRIEGAILGNLGIAWSSLGEQRKAIDFFEQRLVIARATDDRHGEGNTLGNLGMAWCNLGETHKAIEFLGQHLTVARAMGDQRGEGSALCNLGIAWSQLGEPRKAIEFFEQDLAIARTMGDRRGEGITLGNLGLAWRDLGEPRKAIEFFEQCLMIARTMGDRGSEGASLGNLGLAWLDLGEPRKAVEFYEQHIVIAHIIGDQRGEGTSLYNLALVFWGLEQRKKAISLIELSLRIHQKTEDPWEPKVRARLDRWRAEMQTATAENVQP